jgi:ABC-type glycerol-3-phosphate transport system permease component
VRYERRGERPLTRQAFAWRLAIHVAVAGVVVLASLALGMAGYAWFEGLTWLDAFLNAAMLLGGMGPVESPATPMGKLFAGLYALYSGLVFLVLAGIVLAPVVHRILHRFHWTDEQ